MGAFFYVLDDHAKILVVDDDPILREFAQVNLASPNTRIDVASDGVQALDYLTASDDKPFLILSDINLPKLNGLELRAKIHNNEQLRLRCIPYLFFTTSGTHKAVVEAYSQSIQGFFVQPASYATLKQMMQRIIEYWHCCQAPNYV